MYCGAKGIPEQKWSNLNIDVMHGNLGVEHKMLCYRSKPSILAACGTSLMHLRRREAFVSVTCKEILTPRCGASSSSTGNSFKRGSRP